MNKHNNLYIVLLGNEKYDPDCHVKACKRKFDYLHEARNCAKDYWNAHIFKVHYAPNSGTDIEWISEIR